RPRAEHGEMGDELDRCFALLASEGKKASEEVVIRETGRESEDVRVHEACVSRCFSRLPEGSRRRQERRMTTPRNVWATTRRTRTEKRGALSGEASRDSARQQAAALSKTRVRKCEPTKINLAEKSVVVVGRM